MEIKSEQKNNWSCLLLTDRLDVSTAPELEKAGSELLKSNTQMALDFSELTYISSAGLRVLMILGKQAKAAGGQVVLCGFHSLVRDVLEESGVTSIFKTYDSLNDLP